MHCAPLCGACWLIGCSTLLRLVLTKEASNLSLIRHRPSLGADDALAAAGVAHLVATLAAWAAKKLQTPCCRSSKGTLALNVIHANVLHTGKDKRKANGSYACPMASQILGEP
jgi:hypothetical protein